MENKELFFRYGIVQKGNANGSPNFESFECCKMHPLCSEIHNSKKMFTRSEIETLSQKLGYSVWDNIGGNEGCKCEWKSLVVSKK